MRIEQIEQLIEIVECGSIGKAAQKLYVQQPNLSMLVKTIEDEFHQPIFYRTPSGVRLTPFGKDFMAFAEPYYKQYVLLKEIGENSLNAPIEEFKVCSHHMTIARWAFAELCTVYSDRPLRMCVSNVTFEDIPQSVASHQYDIGILGLVKDQSRLHLKIFSSLGLEFVPLGNAHFSVIVGDNHPFVKDHVRSVSLDMCKMYPFVLYRPMEVYLRALESYQQLINHHTLIDVPDYILSQEILRQGKELPPRERAAELIDADMAVHPIPVPVAQHVRRRPHPHPSAVYPLAFSAVCHAFLLPDLLHQEPPCRAEFSHCPIPSLLHLPVFHASFLHDRFVPFVSV